ncbi:MAG: hypothetical protein ABIO70_23280 [Pseudomonadota bacterium]
MDAPFADGIHIALFRALVPAVDLTSRRGKDGASFVLHEIIATTRAASGWDTAPGPATLARWIEDASEAAGSHLTLTRPIEVEPDRFHAQIGAARRWLAAGGEVGLARALAGSELYRGADQRACLRALADLTLACWPLLRAYDDATRIRWLASSAAVAEAFFLGRSPAACLVAHLTHGILRSVAQARATSYRRGDALHDAEDVHQGLYGKVLEGRFAGARGQDWSKLFAMTGNGETILRVLATTVRNELCPPKGSARTNAVEDPDLVASCHGVFTEARTGLEARDAQRTVAAVRDTLLAREAGWLDGSLVDRGGSDLCVRSQRGWHVYEAWRTWLEHDGRTRLVHPEWERLGFSQATYRRVYLAPTLAWIADALGVPQKSVTAEAVRALRAFDGGADPIPPRVPRQPGRELRRGDVGPASGQMW